MIEWRGEIVELLSELVRTDSVNPALGPGGAGEGAIAALVARWARRQGLDARLLDDASGRPSVLLRARGTGGGRTLLLCGHLDTVGVEGMKDPHQPRVDGDRLYGPWGLRHEGGPCRSTPGVSGGVYPRAGGRRDRRCRR